jgi:K+-sensing histidine kinase KdpD
VVTSTRKSLGGFAVAVVIVALTTTIAWTALGQEHLADVVMVYLLGTVLVSMRYGYGPSVLAAVLSVLCFNFFFIPPYYTLAVADLRDLVTFGVMFLVAVIISGLTKRVRDQADAARRLTEEAHRVQLQVEAEQLRNALLSSVSHDLRTPLAVVTGAASTLLEEAISESVRRDLTDTILQEADRLNRLVQNLLDMTRLESGALRVRKQWQPLEEVVGAALNHAEHVLGERDVTTALPSELSLVPLDSVLIEQVLVNLIENAAKYSPRGTPIHVGARRVEGGVELEVADRGPGVPEEQAERIFEKFHRGRTDQGGAGLGLTICRGIVVAHGGRIWSAPREGGGASFRFLLPVEGAAPTFGDELHDAGPITEARAEAP